MISLWFQPVVNSESKDPAKQCKNADLKEVDPNKDAMDDTNQTAKSSTSKKRKYSSKKKVGKAIKTN